MNKFEYKNLTPFKWFVLENFPFIEGDFDALTEWQLFCKLGKEMNKIINNENTLGTQVENVTNAFIELQNYINNYFDNLDVQNEINNKLNEMAEDGSLSNIINQEIFSNINNNIDTINSNSIICIGDSYFNYWAPDFIQNLGLTLNETAFTKSLGGAGFIGTSQSFLSLLQQLNISDKSKIKSIIVCGGYNDRVATDENELMNPIISFINYCKANYPNAKIFIGMIGNDASYNNTQGTLNNIRNILTNLVLKAYKACNLYGATYLNGVEYALINKNLFQDDNVHPNENGGIELTRAIYQAFTSGNFYNSHNAKEFNASNLFIRHQIFDNKLHLFLQINNSEITMNMSSGNSFQYVDFATSQSVNNYLLRYVNNYSFVQGLAQVTLSDGTITHIPYRFRVNNDENGTIQIGYLNNTGNTLNITKVYICDSFILEPKFFTC